tara:strand:+ start:1518 stop:1646 length:129 start_codon:yes stop_codon:yes gene_type:complete
VLQKKYRRDFENLQGIFEIFPEMEVLQFVFEETKTTHHSEWY